MKRFVFIAALFAAACSRHADFSAIHPGMEAQEVLKILGKPAERRPMINSTWWIYSDSAHHVLVMNADTVVRCLTQTEAMKIMEDNLRTFDSLKIR